MLYVFHVDTGTMMTFDMKLAMESVATLQHAIARENPIPEDKQVLLISGGESLDPNATVGKYHAGTDTNPIFLFSKSTIEAQHPPSPSVHYGSDIDVQSQVEGSLLMPPAYGTVVSRAQLALQIHEVDREEIKACEQLVMDQHLQQQGWAAVVANLEDITSALRHRSEIFTESYNEYLTPREEYLKTLSSVEHSLQLLAKIPVLPCLIQSSSSDLCDKSASSSGSSASSSSNKSLFDWISSQDPSHSLHEMVVKCIKATEQLDGRVLDTLTNEVDETFVQVDNPSMKEVKGIEDRLYGLDQILNAGRRVVQEQGDMAQGFIQNQNRVSTLKDKSILPDLCSSHKKQLLVMVNNHKKIQETKKKCKMAKEELAVNLHARLRWVMLVEKRICDVDGKLIIYHENLKRLRKRLDILKQIHDAPDMYANLVVEVVRRRKFSGTFTEWASSVAEESIQIHSEEYKRREAFINQLGRHFLQTLFTGLDPLESNFAMEAPAAIDQKLPDITEEDIKMLQSSVPELADLLVIPTESSKIMKSHWGVLTCTTNKPQAPKSLQTSEIEIIHSYDERFFTADHKELSLGDQVASSELTSNLLVKSDIGITSPTEKTEFIMPKSLSEELTKEMQEASQKKELEGSSVDSKQKEVTRTAKLTNTGEVSGTSSSSGDQMKSTESEISSHDKSTESSHSGKKKSGLPDMDNSQEFTTADFYIEDSMPSSIAGSPPHKTKSEKHDKSETDYKTRYIIAKTEHQHIMGVLASLFPEIKQELKEFESRVICDRTNFIDEIERTKQTVSEMLSAFDHNMQSQSQNEIEKLEKCHEDKLDTLNSQIDTLKKENSLLEQQMGELKTEIQNSQDSKLNELEKRNSELQTLVDKGISDKTEFEMKIKALNEKVENCNIESNTKIKDLTLEYEKLESKHKQELLELMQQHSLEMEVELDKAKSELLIQIGELENEAKVKSEKVDLVQSELSSATNNLIKLEEELTSKYQTEKETIKQILTEEFNEKILLEREQNVCKIKEAMEEYDSKLSSLKEQMLQERQLHIKNLEEEHESVISDTKEKYEAEKDQLLHQQKEELLTQHSKVLTDMNKEFNKYKVDIENQLKVYTDREFNDIDIQTNTCDQIYCAIQTDPLSCVSAGLQTEPELMREVGEVQTDLIVTNTDETQTDSNAVTHEETQTVIKEMIQGNTQTEEREVVQGETQTEHRTVSLGETQTVKVEVNQGETQTDRKEVIPGETQTSKTEINQGETQTDIREVIQVEMQTDSWVGVLGVTPTEVEDRCIQTEDLQSADKQEEIYKQKLLELEQQHQREINDLVCKLEKDKEESCSSLKTSLIAERQVSFNEAVNKVSSKKDSIIGELREKESALTEKLRLAQETIEKLSEEKSKVEDVKTRALAHLNDKEREFLASKRSLEDNVGMLTQQLTQYQQQIQSMSIMAVSSAQSVMEISTLDDKDSKTKISLLEEEVKQKQEEISRMEQKLSEMTMSTSTRTVVQDKVSITSCNTGDLALFCLDERHDQYVVFTIGSTLHFLHSDCIEPLGLQPNPNESRKSWVLAEITEKEYCQAKKAQNRFKVPLGTKFYRVKAKPWSKDSSPRKGDTASGSS